MPQTLPGRGPTAMEVVVGGHKVKVARTARAKRKRMVEAAAAEILP
jgi:hypothetical protein